LGHNTTLKCILVPKGGVPALYLAEYYMSATSFNTALKELLRKGVVKNIKQAGMNWLIPFLACGLCEDGKSGKLAVNNLAKSAREQEQCQSVVDCFALKRHMSRLFR